MDEIREGSTIIHNGVEKRVNEVRGDILVLSDGITVLMSDVSYMQTVENPQEREKSQTQEQISPEDQTSKDELRREIESINENTPVASVMNTMERVDSSMVINTKVNFDLFRTDILRRALDLRKIDPKTCNACGQIIAD